MTMLEIVGAAALLVVIFGGLAIATHYEREFLLTMMSGSSQPPEPMREHRQPRR